MIGLGDRPSAAPNIHADKAFAGYPLLRRIVAELGGSSRAIASHPEMLAALFDWSAIHAPRLLPLLNGHFHLTLGVIERFGDRSQYQRRLRRALDSVAATGAWLHNEGPPGPVVTAQQIRAEWQSDGSFRLTTPVLGAYPWIASVGAEKEPKVVVVTARLIIRGVDKGAFPVVLRLRRADGSLVAGVRVAMLPARGDGPVDDAMVELSGVRVSADALVRGEWAHLDTEGRFRCTVSPAERCDRVNAQVQAGRLSLASAAVAAARGGVALTWRYAGGLPTAGGAVSADRDAIRDELVSATARVCAMTTLVNAVRQRVAANPGSPAAMMLTLLATPVLSRVAQEILHECRELSTAQGMYAVNYLSTWIDVVDGAVIASSDNRLLEVTAGHRLARRHSGRIEHELLTAVDSHEVLPWWHRMLADREQTMLDDAQHGELVGVVATGPERAAISISRAVQDRLASESLAVAATSLTEPVARAIAGNLAAVFALDCIDRSSGWYSARGRMTPDLALTVRQTLASRYIMLAPHMSTLLAAFEIPLERLDAPMAGDYTAWWRDYAGRLDSPSTAEREGGQ